MKIAEQTYTLKTGEEILIREGSIPDSGALLDMVREYVLTSKFLIVSPEELAQTVADEARWIKSLRDSQNSLLLLALHEGRLIGNIDLTGSDEPGENPTGLISMGMLQAYRNKGLGSILLKAVVDWARANHQLQVLCLQVVGANTGAMKLYRKQGFEVANRQTNGFSDGEGNRSDNVVMTLSL
ncbi:GNAT family N-acetyltransferase [Pontibacter liquoris]|uniref:GNAT family N-acetyltransferase n=1 Tax=Pontibacter liquoris TaxID=2905677 RepID=UPI001FA70651|nr:GNAT family N-acetyltransferase [Pontibacter liquoris]